MISNVSSWSIRNPITIILLFALLMFAGLYGFNAMKIQNFPDFDLPTITVTAILPGASPVQLENDVARKIEDTVASLQDVKHIHTTLSDGSVEITVEFRLEKPLQEALDEVRDAVSRVRADLPADLHDPVIKKLMTSDSAVLTYTVVSKQMDDEALSWFVDNQLSRLLLTVPGVGTVTRVGGVFREIRVELDVVKLLALNTTAADISRQLRLVQQEASGGRTILGSNEQLVRMVATVQSAEELAQMEVPLPDGRAIRLDHIAKVYDTTTEPRSAAMLDGQPVVGFELTRARGASEVDMMQGVRVALDSLQMTHPDINITEALNFVDPIQENFNGSMKLLYEGAALAILVVFLFLRDWRATFVSAVALPLSAIPTFAVMNWMGFSLDTVSLLSLSLVVGVLVDDAIVEIENIIRHLRMGKSPYQAAMEAADEIGLAVVSTTFTLIAVFLPTAFMEGIAGKFFVQFGWTAAIAVFFSLVVARMLTPMMAAYLLKPRSQEAEPSWLAHYSTWVQWCLRHRGATLTTVGVFFIGSVALIPLLSTEFMPPDDVPQTQITITLPPGSMLKQTYVIAEQARALIQSNPQITLVYTTIGGGSASADPLSTDPHNNTYTAVLTLQLTHRDKRPGISRQNIETQLREALQILPGVRIKVGMGDSENYVLVLSGEDYQQLTQHSQQVEKELRTLPGIGTVTSTASLNRPELIVRPDFSRAANFGVTSEAIADTLRIATSGDYVPALAKLNLSERQLPIVVRLADSVRQELDQLKRLSVPSVFGPVALESVTTLDVSSGPSDITRYDRMRNVNFEVELNGQPLGKIEQAAAILPSLTNLPTGIFQTPVGDAEVMGELFSSFGFAMGIGVLCIYMVLVLLFKDFVQPVTILAALLLSIPGAILALFITHSALSMPSMIGLIMLMGIATKNSILLIDYIILARREHGLERWSAVIDACHKRARPIVMTTLAMGAGMTPIALGWGADPSFRSPMAIVVVGGLITSTLLSLLVIPIVFTYIDDFLSWTRVKFTKLSHLGSNVAK